MGVLLLVRHGQASFQSDDYDVLSDTGHAQGAALGRALAEREIRPDVVVRGAGTARPRTPRSRPPAGRRPSRRTPAGTSSTR